VVGVLCGRTSLIAQTLPDMGHIGGKDLFVVHLVRGNSQFDLKWGTVGAQSRHSMRLPSNEPSPVARYWAIPVRCLARNSLGIIKSPISFPTACPRHYPTPRSAA